MQGECPFTGLECDGGEVHADGTAGCAFKNAPGDGCAWRADVPHGTSPRDFYNETIMGVMTQ